MKPVILMSFAKGAVTSATIKKVEDALSAQGVAFAAVPYTPSSNERPPEFAYFLTGDQPKQ